MYDAALLPLDPSHRGPSPCLLLRAPGLPVPALWRLSSAPTIWTQFSTRHRSWPLRSASVPTLAALEAASPFSSVPLPSLRASHNHEVRFSLLFCATWPLVCPSTPLTRLASRAPSSHGCPRSHRLSLPTGVENGPRSPTRVLRETLCLTFHIPSCFACPLPLMGWVRCSFPGLVLLS